MRERVKQVPCVNLGQGWGGGGSLCGEKPSPQGTAFETRGASNVEGGDTPLITAHSCLGCH